MPTTSTVIQRISQQVRLRRILETFTNFSRRSEALLIAIDNLPDLAHCSLIEALVGVIAPGGGLSIISYGALKLLPLWDPLRGDPRFEQIVASLAPKQ